MTFVQPEFLAFFAIVYGLYWALPRVGQNVLLLVSSAVFYGWVHPWFLVLLYGSAVLDYSCGLAMRSWPQWKRAFLSISLAGNLGLLGWFKYMDFLLENVAAALDAMGVGNSVHTLGIFLPVGISFYTFQTMSYTLDIFKGELEPRKNLLDYLVFISFFPQLVAGPVERASNLLPQCEQPRRFTWDQTWSGLSLSLWGAFKKVCVADVISPYVDKIFVLTDPSWPLVWAATLGFTLQILADFSGYTDIARGISRMMGFELMENFKNPYLAKDPSDFWRRWHISFSTWIRDYLYIPLGGNRGGFWGTTRSTFGAMTLSGFWHGASWNFVLWGVFHASLITGYRLVKPLIPRAVRNAPGSGAAAVLLMFAFTTVSWLLFRETHLGRLVGHLTQVPWEAPREAWAAAGVMLATTALCALPLFVALVWERQITPRLESTGWGWPVRTALWTAGAAAILTFARVGGGDFIYFQF